MQKISREIPTNISSCHEETVTMPYHNTSWRKLVACVVTFFLSVREFKIYEVFYPGDFS